MRLGTSCKQASACARRPKHSRSDSPQPRGSATPPGMCPKTPEPHPKSPSQPRVVISFSQGLRNDLERPKPRNLTPRRVICSSPTEPRLLNRTLLGMSRKTTRPPEFGLSCLDEGQNRCLTIGGRCRLTDGLPLIARNAAEIDGDSVWRAPACARLAIRSGSIKRPRGPSPSPTLESIQEFRAMLNADAPVTSVAENG